MRISPPPRARLRGARIIGSGALLCALGPLLATLGCRSTLPDRAERMERGYVYYLDGAGGGGALRNWSSGVRDGLLAAGYAGAGEMFTWETGLGLAADQIASVEYKREKAAELAQRIVEYSAEHRDAPVFLIGLSAGTVIAVYALEALPQDVSVEDVILLSGSLSADYDVTAALRHVRTHLYVFTSDRDGMLLYLEPMFGTADRRFSGAGPIGLRGLELPAGASAETRRQYRKVVHIPWSEEFARVGERGGHFDAVKGPFVRSRIAPLILPALTSSAAAGSARAAASGTVPNPDFVRWVRFGVGSSQTLEGYQVMNGIRQPLRLTTTLLAKYPDSLLLERRIEPLDGESGDAPQVRRSFVPARIAPEEHPLTHPQALLWELPREIVAVDSDELDCDVKMVSVAADFPAWGRDVAACVWSNATIPGGVMRAEIHATLNGQPTEYAGRLCDYTVASP